MDVFCIHTADTRHSLKHRGRDFAFGSGSEVSGFRTARSLHVDKQTLAPEIDLGLVVSEQNSLRRWNQRVAGLVVLARRRSLVARFEYRLIARSEPSRQSSYL